MTMNGLANALSAFNFVINGYVIGISGSYMADLMLIVGMRVFGSECLGLSVWV